MNVLITFQISLVKKINFSLDIEKMNLKPDVLIVGAGVAGITCALRCQEMGMNFLIIEKNDRVGGRLGSVYEDGYTFDIGFQVFNSSYHETKNL